jgi:hypothetical protein
MPPGEARQFFLQTRMWSKRIGWLNDMRNQKHMMEYEHYIQIHMKYSTLSSNDIVFRNLHVFGGFLRQ